MDERFNQALPRVEEELKKVIAYLNDQVVPQLRQDSSQALHAAADRLRKLAEQLDDRPGAERARVSRAASVLRALPQGDC